MPANHLILCHPRLLLLSIFPSIRVFSNEPVPPFPQLSGLTRQIMKQIWHVDVTYFILCSSEIFLSLHKGGHSLANLLFYLRVLVCRSQCSESRLSVAISISAGPWAPWHKGEGQQRNESRSALQNTDRSPGLIKSAAPRGQFKNQLCPSPAAQLNSILETAEQATCPRLCDLGNWRDKEKNHPFHDSKTHRIQRNTDVIISLEVKSEKLDGVGKEVEVGS